MGSPALLRDAEIIAATTTWLEAAVIGLNLCPFAKAVLVRQQIRFTVSHAMTQEALLSDLLRELQYLGDADADIIDTTLLIHPFVFEDFLDCNDFLDIADAAVAELELEGVIQIANFHPRFQFEGTRADDLSNCTNRSPYPTLHLLREASVTRAVAVFPEASAIFEKNLKTLDELGPAGWEKLAASWLTIGALTKHSRPDDSAS